MGGSAIVVAAERAAREFPRGRGERLDVRGRRRSGRRRRRDRARRPPCDAGRLAPELSADGTFDNSKATYTYGTAVAHVAVDPRTGHVEVVDYVVVDDVGRIINPLTLHGQVVGAAVQGLGSVFSEEIAYDANGQLLVGSLADYLIPLATDYPQRARDLARRASLAQQSARRQGRGRGRHHPGRRRGLERGRDRAASLGVEPRELPLTPPRVWQLIQDAREKHFSST